MEFNSKSPIYLQIYDLVCEWIIKGKYYPGARLPSVRELSESLGVNPNTVARAYERLTSKGVIYNKRGKGYFLSLNASVKIKEEEKRKFIEEELPAFVERAQLLGINLGELI